MISKFHWLASKVSKEKVVNLLRRLSYTTSNPKLRWHYKKKKKFEKRKKSLQALKEEEKKLEFAQLAFDKYKSTNFYPGK